MNRLPIRIRLTLVFAMALATVLGAVGAFVYLRVGTSLDEQLGESLASRAKLLAESLDHESVPSSLPGDDEEFAQLVASNGDVLAATPGYENVEAHLAADSRVRSLRLRDGRTLVVGASLEDRDEALAALLGQLLLGGVMALLLVSLLAYLVAGAALRPVEAMRRRAAEISADTSANRLPVPKADDEISRLGETLNAMLERLDDGLRRERRFVADAGHELRTPLALLKTEIELALRRPRPARELENALRSAGDEADRLTRLAEDLLVLASAQDGVLPLHPSRFAASDLLDDVAARFRSRAGAAGRSLEVVGSGGGVVAGDRLRLEQALGNLVDNALRHGAGRIRLAAAPVNGSIELSVADEGAGFPSGFSAQAFERFSRADESRTRSGAGLGLAIVDAIARAHGGAARAANTTAGAIVTVTLPGSRN